MRTSDFYPYLDAFRVQRDSQDVWTGYYFSRTLCIACLTPLFIAVALGFWRHINTYRFSGCGVYFQKHAGRDGYLQTWRHRAIYHMWVRGMHVLDIALRSRVK